MQAKPTTLRIRDRAVSVIASDIPPDMTVAQYRRRHASAEISPAKSRVRLFGGRR
jgi:hypothetical protein